MAFSAENFLLIGSVLLFVSIAAGKTGYRFGVPALLLFLAVGMIFGSDGIGVQFSSFKQAQFIGMTALSVILFSGGMDTKINEVRPVMFEGITLSTLGVFLTTAITGIFIYGMELMFPNVISLSFAGCFLLASVMSSTDSASVFSILRAKNLNLRQNLRPLLEFESGSNDPMAYMLTILFIEMIQLSNLTLGVMLWALVLQLVLGIIVGYFLGRVTVFVINNINLDYSALYSVLLLAFALFTFSFTNSINGNGYLAVYIAGLVVGNNKMMYKKSVTIFFDGIAWLFQIIMFLTLGLLVNPKSLMDIALPALIIGLFMILAARPLSVFASLMPFKKLNSNGKWFISWVGLRGAVPIIFATYPYVAGVKGANEIFNIVFFITIVSLIVQGSTVPYAAKVLGLVCDAPEHKDFAIEVPEDLAVTSELMVGESMLSKGRCLCDIAMPDDTAVMMIKREGKFFIPNPKTELKPGDKLLIVAGKEEELKDVYGRLGINTYSVYKN